MAHQDRKKISSWYTDSTYNADESYENSPFATDPHTFPRRASTATSASYSHPFAAIPLPSQFQLHTIEEMRNEVEVAEPCPPAIRRFMESSAMKNEELVEKSLKSISLIRSRLLQQQEANRKRNCEFQRIRSSLEVVRSLVHLIPDETTNKIMIEFSNEDLKISPKARNFKLLKMEKENAVDSADGPENLEPKTPTQANIGSGFANTSHNTKPNSPAKACMNDPKLDSSARSFKAMSTTANVPTTPTKIVKNPVTGIRNAYRYQSQEDLLLASDLLLTQEMQPQKIPIFT